MVNASSNLPEKSKQAFVGQGGADSKATANMNTAGNNSGGGSNGSSGGNSNNSDNKRRKKKNRKKDKKNKKGKKQNKKQKTIFGIDLKSILATIGLALFFVLAMVGVLIVWRQRLQPEKVATPTAPKSKPAAAVQPSDGSCTVGFNVSGSTDLTCTKESYANEDTNTAGSYEYTTQQTEFKPEEIVVFKLEATNNGQQAETFQLQDVLGDEGLTTVAFLDSTCGADAYDEQNDLLTCPVSQLAAGANEIIGFRVQIAQRETFAPDPGPYELKNVASLEQDGAELTTCGQTITVVSEVEPTYGLECVKKVYADLGSLEDFSEPKTEFKPGETVLYKIPVENTGDTALGTVFLDEIDENLEFVDSNCTTETFDETNNILECDLGELEPETEPLPYVAFRAKVDATLTEEVTIPNESTAQSSADNGDTATASCSIDLVVKPEEETVYDCDVSCDNDEQCQEANADYTCSTAEGDVCRLESNPSDENCEPKEKEYACNSSCESNAECQTANSSYICYNDLCRLDVNPTASNCQPDEEEEDPAIGCNDTCVSNADCDNSAHICYNTQCRLATNPESETCSPAGGGTTTTTGTTTQQPELPTELPETGAQDILNWLKAGAGVLGIGTVLLLLLQSAHHLSATQQI